MSRCLLWITWSTGLWTASEVLASGTGAAEETGEVVGITETNYYPWGLFQVEGCAWNDYPEQNPCLIRSDVWKNYQEKYYMRCFKHTQVAEGASKASIYYEENKNKALEPIMTVVVTSCDPVILKSITIMPRRRKTHTVMLLGTQKCEMHTIKIYIKDDTSDCPAKNNRRSQKNDVEYTNGWKVDDRVI